MRALAVVAAVALTAPMSAHAATHLTEVRTDAGGTRGWTLFRLDTTEWKPAPATAPADGTVEGYRYAASATPRPPRALQTFPEVCGQTPAVSGKKRVAVVVDPGRAADAAGPGTIPAPSATCVVAAPQATSSQVLAAARTVRAQGEQVCAIGGYPAAGCREPLATLTPAQLAPDDAYALPDASTAQPTSPSSTPGTGAAAKTSAGSSPAMWLGLVAAGLGIAAVGSAFFPRRRRAARRRTVRRQDAGTRRDTARRRETDPTSTSAATRADRHR